MRNVVERTVQSLFIGCLCILVGSAQEKDPRGLIIIPTPQHVEVRNSGFVISSSTKIVLESDSEEDRFAARQINDELARWTHSMMPVVHGKSQGGPSSKFIYLGSVASEAGREFLATHHELSAPGMTDEGYFLDIDSSGIMILASSEKGRFYGVMTLLQMMRREERSVVVDGATISDYPLYSMRGISDDISRGQVSTLDNFKSIIRFLARYKMNVYAPYLEDMVALPSHPLIGKGRGALTLAELRDLDLFAQRYHVQLLPIFQTLGHCENLLSIPEYLSYAEYPGGRTLNIADERVYALLDEMIGGICSSLSSPYFNMAADETRDVGLGANKERVKQLGLSAVLAVHYRRVADIIRRHGKIPMIYGDILIKNPDILTKIPKDIVIVDWNYDPQFTYDSPKVFRDAGFQVVVSPAVRNYRGPFIDYLNSFENIERFSRAGYEQGSLGMLLSSWNDYGGEELREFNFPGYAWGAQCGWAPYTTDVAAFNKGFFADQFGASAATAIQTAYALLSSPANYFTWYELWRHPMLPFLPPVPTKGHSPVIMERLQSIKSTMPLVQSILRSVDTSRMRNPEHLEYLQFVASLNLWFAKKVETLERVQMLSKEAEAGQHPGENGLLIIKLCRGVVTDLSSLRTRFEKLWLKTNRPEGLEYLLMRYDRQKAYWEEKIAQVKAGTFRVDPLIESSWIYHPDAAVAARPVRQVQHTYFRKNFMVHEKPQDAKLQIIGDTYVKVWVNEQYCGEVFVRRSNSLSAEHKRIMTIDLAPFLLDSLNVITVEAEDYSVAGSAGANLYGEMRFRNGVMEKITSDSTWRVTDSAGRDWKRVKFDDSAWRNAAPRPYPYQVVRPDFQTGRPSWIEQ